MEGTICEIICIDRKKLPYFYDTNSRSGETAEVCGEMIKLRENTFISLRGLQAFQAEIEIKFIRSVINF